MTKTPIKASIRSTFRTDLLPGYVFMVADRVGNFIQAYLCVSPTFRILGADAGLARVVISSDVDLLP